MAEKKKIVIPESLRNVLNNPEGFSVEEIMNVLEKQENKNFLNEIKPLVIEMLKKEFPFISMFL
jgi:hypothetical protein